MSNPNSQFGIYRDLLVAEALLGDQRVLKKAQAGNIASSIVDKVKNYFGSKINPDDKAGSLLNMLAPGIIRTTFAAMGMPWLGMLIGLADSFFHWDVASILRDIWSKLKEALSGGAKMTSEQVHNIVTSTVGDHNKPATQEEADAAAQTADQQGKDLGQNQADDGLSTASQLRIARMMRLALEDYAFNKQAAGKGWFNLFSSRKSATGNVLSSLLSLIFRVALSSAGLLVAGDVMNSFLNRPNSFDGTIQKGKPVEQSPETPPPSSLPVSSRPVKPGYVDSPKNTSSTNWVENVSNNDASIEQMLLNFAKDVYPIDGQQESAIEANPQFQRLVRLVVWYNHESPGGPVVFIPRMFTTKKQLVDSFIDAALPQKPQANG